MSGLVATPGASEMLIVWFVLMMVGMLAIGVVLGAAFRKDEKPDKSVHHLQDPRELPLRSVRDALRPPRPPAPVLTPEELAERRQRRRRRHYQTRNPNGPRLVK